MKKLVDLSMKVTGTNLMSFVAGIFAANVVEPSETVRQTLKEVKREVGKLF